ncbi:protein arginine N-methyltransferase 6 [Sitophilus oryzae]|uniref:Protein arginine N-methyltransferase 6 n=1 Tax=Sitophilus oryzae TaxID=7048 RepID=A0A6J2Y9F9_SITOR|nr:protein arginine N-methyltransferase 6 [Sitophilus oryzae]
MDIDNINSTYFENYEDLEIHKLMLKDSTRNNAYQKAILNNKNNILNKVVLDVGAGTGILSILCAQAGARKVYAVEASETYKIAKEIVKENGFENVIEVIHSRIEDLTDSEIPEKVDVIVSEWMGFYLLHEGMLDSVITARDRFLKSDGLIFPESAAIYASPCSIPSMYNDWNDISGVSMQSFAKLLRNEALKKPLTESLSPNDLLSEPEVVSWIDLREVTIEDLKEFSFQHVAVSTKTALYQGVCLWFTCTFPFSGFDEPVVLSTAPDEPGTHWKQTLIVLPESIKVEPGSPICYDLVMRRSESNSRRYIIEIAMLDPDEVEHPEFCSCFMTKCILVKAVLKKYEKGVDVPMK